AGRRRPLQESDQFARVWRANGYDARIVNDQVLESSEGAEGWDVGSRAMATLAGGRHGAKDVVRRKSAFLSSRATALVQREVRVRVAPPDARRCENDGQEQRRAHLIAPV